MCVPMLHQVLDLPAEEPTVYDGRAKYHSGVSFTWNDFKFIY